MAITVVLALTAAMILALTLVPAAVSLFVTGRVDETENRLMGWISRRYEPLLGQLLARPKQVVAGAGLLVVLAGLCGRKRVVAGKSVSVRVVFGWRRSL